MTAWRGIWFSLLGLALALAGLGVVLVKLAVVALHPEAPGVHLVLPAVLVLAAVSVILGLLVVWHGRPARRRRHLRNAFEVMAVLCLGAGAIWGWDRMHPQPQDLDLAFDGKIYQIPRVYHPIAYPERGLILGLCARTLEPEYAAQSCDAFAEMRFNRLPILDDPALIDCVRASGGQYQGGRLLAPGASAQSVGPQALRYACSGTIGGQMRELYLQLDPAGQVIAYTRLTDGTESVEHGLRLGDLSLHFPASETADPATEARRWLDLLESWRCPEAGCPPSPPVQLDQIIKG
ncbi:hypothetical protein [Gemmobacter serpentinus]|uniref:hypothetical protein n=1 Tax=Gemmobacter serpentinus TaxID=2652247 RepID=UPI00124CC1DC|nr:hypothetical protein [Gemmobacter serpentinus]